MSDPGPAGYRLPAEFEPHEATWMAWPHDERTWIAGLEAAEEAFARMIEALSKGERLDLLVRPQDRSRAEDVLSTRSLGDLRWHEKEHADAWLRDTGPTVLVRDGDRLALDWRFDAWGGKYEDLERDDDVAAFIADVAGIPRLRVDEVCEGGAFDTDGQGRVLTTRECMIEGRGHTEPGVVALFEQFLCAREIIWLHGGLQGDDTDGHVDTVARFLSPDVLAIATAHGPEDPDRDLLAENRRIVKSLDVDLVELPQPATVEIRGQPRPASYANLYIGNDVVLLPTYEDPNDDVAARRLAEALPGRRIVPIPARPLVAGYGACHCLTQPIPASA